MDQKTCQPHGMPGRLVVLGPKFGNLYTTDQIVRYAAGILNLMDVPTYVLELRGSTGMRVENALAGLGNPDHVTVQRAWACAGQEFMRYAVSLLERGDVVCMKEYVPDTGLEIAWRAGLRGERALASVRAYCELCYGEFGYPREDLGRVYQEPRFDRIVERVQSRQGGPTDTPRPINEAMIERREIFSRIIEPWDYWGVCLAGKEQVHIEPDGSVVSEEGIDHNFRSYHELTYEYLGLMMPDSIPKLPYDEFLRLYSLVKFS